MKGPAVVTATTLWSPLSPSTRFFKSHHIIRFLQHPSGRDALNPHFMSEEKEMTRAGIVAYARSPERGL